MRATHDRPSIDNWPPRSPISLSPGIAWWLLAFIGPHLPNGIAFDWRVMSPTGWLLKLTNGCYAAVHLRPAGARKPARFNVRSLFMAEVEEGLSSIAAKAIACRA